MLIVSDNGSNMVKAIRLLQEVHAAKKFDKSESYEFESDEPEPETDEEEAQSQSEQTDLPLIIFHIVECPEWLTHSSFS